MHTENRISTPAIMAVALAASPLLGQDTGPEYTPDEFAQLMLDSTTRQREEAENPVPTVYGSPHLLAGEICQAVLDVRELDSASIGDYDELPRYLENFLRMQWITLHDLGPDRLIYRLLEVDCRTDSPDKPIEAYTVSMVWTPRADREPNWSMRACASDLIGNKQAPICNPAADKPRAPPKVQSVELPPRRPI